MNDVTKYLRDRLYAREWGINASNAHTEIRTNHLGYLPNAPKTAVLNAEGTFTFRLSNCATGEVLDEQTITAEKRDFGWTAQYHFDHVTVPGAYYIQAGIYRTFSFRIWDEALDEAIYWPVHSFSVQRCGPSTTGYHSPCHCDDGIRKDNGQYQDLTGGWHDSCDLRKWVYSGLDGMLGLSMVYELQGDVIRPGGILEELQWGNRYFLNLQEPDGYIMGHCGGDVFFHSDNNRWTDNIPGTEDDRIIETDPCPMIGQFRFVFCQAMAARVARKHGEEAYAQRCLDAADRCLIWALAQLNDDTDVEVLADAMTAGLEMYRTTGNEAYLETASRMADLVLALQVHDYEPVHGFFLTSKTDPEPYRPFCSMREPVGIALSLMVEHASHHPNAHRWKDALREWAMDYILPMSRKNGYGMVPQGLFSWDAGGGRRCGDKYYYRNFMSHYNPRQNLMSIDPTVWIGINGYISAVGVALAKASQLLQEPELLQVAQRQLDWIIGSNPFDDSHMDLVGRNNHIPFGPPAWFTPFPPRIRGAVCNGIVGTAEDEPDHRDGFFAMCEYWTPMTAHTMWLAALLKSIQLP